jgi:hypothetical protein
MTKVAFKPANQTQEFAANASSATITRVQPYRGNDGTNEAIQRTDDYIDVEASDVHGIASSQGRRSTTTHTREPLLHHAQHHEASRNRNVTEDNADDHSDSDNDEDEDEDDDENEVASRHQMADRDVIHLAEMDLRKVLARTAQTRMANQKVSFVALPW